MSSQVQASKGKRPAPPPPRNSEQQSRTILSKPPPPKRPSPQPFPTKPLPPPTAVNGTEHQQQRNTSGQSLAVTSHPPTQPTSPSRSSSSNLQSDQKLRRSSTSPPREPPLPPSPAREANQAQQQQRPQRSSLSPPRQAPQPPPARPSHARHTAGNVTSQQTEAQRPLPTPQQSSSTRQPHKPLSSTGSNAGSVPSHDQLMVKYKTVERNYEQLKNVARKGK